MLLTDYKRQITELTNEIKVLRKEVSLCEGIENRSMQINQFEKEREVKQREGKVR